MSAWYVDHCPSVVDAVRLWLILHIYPHQLLMFTLLPWACAQTSVATRCARISQPFDCWRTKRPVFGILPQSSFFYHCAIYISSTPDFMFSVLFLIIVASSNLLLFVYDTLLRRNISLDGTINTFNDGGLGAHLLGFLSASTAMFLLYISVCLLEPKLGLSSRPHWLWLLYDGSFLPVKICFVSPLWMHACMSWSDCCRFITTCKEILSLQAHTGEAFLVSQ